MKNTIINIESIYVSLADYRTYGVPTVRTDLAAPRIRRVDDRKNYGDESDAYGLLNPSVFSIRGVHEKEFLMPRSRESVSLILQVFFFLIWMVWSCFLQNKILYVNIIIAFTCSHLVYDTDLKYEEFWIKIS